jgi:hypothetical protein
VSTTGNIVAGELTATRGRRPIGAAPHLGDHVARQLEALSRLGASNAETRSRIRTVFDILTRESLDRPAEPPFGGLSFINADGLPFQWVFRFDGGTPSWGFLCEAGRPGMHLAARHGHTLRCIDAACVAAGGVAPACLDAVSRRLMPAADAAWPSHWRSASWVGVAIKDNVIQIKPYFNLNRGPARERWLRAGWVLKDLGRDRALEQFCALSSRCSQDSRPVGLALDVRRDGEPGRIKIYFKSMAVGPDWLARWYDAVGLDAHAPSVQRLLDLLGRTGRGGYPPSGFVVSLEIYADELMSLKTDVAVTKWMPSDAQVAERCVALIGSLGQRPDRLGEGLRAIGAWPLASDACDDLRFVGLGCEPDGTQHVNVYVAPPIRGEKAPPPCKPTTDAKAIRRAIERGLTFLTSFCCDRHWEDFSLPVGSSDAWVTAYVLAKLAELPRNLRDFGIESGRAALDWLAASRTANGGWGYHRDVPDDADSTAWAILALRAWHRPVPHVALDFLESCVSDEGGVATYPRPRLGPRRP